MEVLMEAQTFELKTPVSISIEQVSRKV